jgi:branched-chain amino acid transport system substrate-binding protein
LFDLPPPDFIFVNDPPSPHAAKQWSAEMTLTRRSLLAAAATLPVAATGAEDPILAGVSGPLTGPNGQYGAQWKRGFDLALDRINGAGGVRGRPIQYVFQDSQSDPRQSVAVAQKFVSDPRVIIELGDFSSLASMAASPIYQRGGLVQFGFTNSHPDFTRGGDHMWSNLANQAEEQLNLAKYAAALGMKRPALLYLNTDWGRACKDLFVVAAPGLGMAIADVEGYLFDEQDFRPTLVRARDSEPDGLVLQSNYPDGALISRHARDAGLALPILAGTSNYWPKFIELGGSGVEGDYVMSTFFPGDPRPEVQAFVAAYRQKYNLEPESFSADAYDTMMLFAALVRDYGATRADIQRGLLEIRDVPSVIYGKVTFNPATRRVQRVNFKLLQVKGARFVAASVTQRPAG